MDASGNVFVADASNNAIRTISPNGVVSTLAGSPSQAIGHADGAGRAASFNSLRGIRIHADGIAYVTDYNNNAIRAISPFGLVMTLAGSPAQTWGHVDGACVSATFALPVGIAIDARGTLYISDYGSGIIRMITTPSSPSTTQTLTASPSPSPTQTPSLSCTPSITSTATLSPFTPAPPSAAAAALPIGNVAAGVGAALAGLAWLVLVRHFSARKSMPAFRASGSGAVDDDSFAYETLASASPSPSPSLSLFDSLARLFSRRIPAPTFRAVAVLNGDGVVVDNDLRAPLMGEQRR